MARKHILNQDGTPNWDTIAGFKERLDGHDSSINNNVSALADIVTNVVRVFGADPTGVNDSTTAISNALNSNNTVVYFPPGTYKITSGIIVNAGSVKKIIGTRNTTFSIQIPTATTLFHFYNNVEVELFTFDFNNGYANAGLSYEENLGTIRLRHLKFKNVKDMDSTTSSILINIPTYGNVVDIDTIEFNSINKKGNGTVGDGGGNITAIYIADKVTSAPTNGTIRNIRIIEMHNIDANGNIIFEDTSGIYPYSAYTGSDGNLVIDNVYGYNFGKRLIKLDNQNTTINKVYGYSSTNDALSTIGINNSSGSKVKFILTNIQIYGAMNIGIATASNNTTIDNVIIDIQRPSMTGNNANAFGISVASSQVSINNAIITAERDILINGTSSNIVQDLKISNSTLTVPSWGVANIHIPSGGYGFKNLMLQNVTAFNNCTSNGQTGSFIDTSILNGNAWNQRGKGLTITNCTFYSVIANAYGLNLKYVDDITIINYTYNNDGVTQSWIGINVDTCKNLRIENYTCNAYTHAAITSTNTDNIRVLGLTTSNATYSVTCSTSTNIRLKDVDKTKVFMNDATSSQNALFESDSSYGTTVNRTILAYVGDEYYDTTLNKRIRCKTTGTKEVDTLTISAGATTNGNITITLNGVSTTVAVTAGMTAGQVGDVIRGVVFKQWIVGGTSGSSSVTFTKTTGGTNTTPTFADTGTTGVTASFSVTTVGTNPVWVDNATNANPDSVGLNVAVTASATTLLVTFTTPEADINYLVNVTPAWNTNYWITGKQTGQFTINFGTAPVSASTLDWSIRR